MNIEKTEEVVTPDLGPGIVMTLKDSDDNEVEITDNKLGPGDYKMIVKRTSKSIESEKNQETQIPIEYLLIALVSLLGIPTLIFKFKK